MAEPSFAGFRVLVRNAESCLFVSCYWRGHHAVDFRVETRWKNAAWEVSDGESDGFGEI